MVDCRPMICSGRLYSNHDLEHGVQAGHSLWAEEVRTFSVEQAGERGTPAARVLHKSLQYNHYLAHLTIILGCNHIDVDAARH